MTNYEADLELDRRKLIIIFVVLIAFCGGFFVLGYYEGKRQGSQEGTQAVGKPPDTSNSEEITRTTEEKPEEPDNQKLDWYKNLNRQEAEPEVTTSEAESEVESNKPLHEQKPPVEPDEKPVPKSEKPVNAVVELAAYSVQVGAFRQKREIDAKANMLRVKGFESRIESPQEPDQLYLLKVGMFKTRAEAIAMQARLKKSGFPSFIKTNKK
jgi:cell division protein FtsN